MAITSMDQLVFALANGEHRHFFRGQLTCTANQMQSRMTAVGFPGPGVVTLSGATNGAIPTQTTAGALWRFTNPSGSNTLYLAQLTVFQDANVNTPVLFLYDRLFHAGSFNGTTTSITITAPPALTRPDSTGANTELWVEVATATTTSQTITVTYTNPAGTGSRTATGTILASTVLGQMTKLKLAAGDSGVQSIQSYTLSGSLTAGTINLVILRRITATFCGIGGSAQGLISMNAMALGLPVVYSDAYAMLVSLNPVTTTDQTYGSATFVQG